MSAGRRISDEARAEIRRRIALAVARKALRRTSPPPRYDEVFFEGVAALDALNQPESGPLPCGVYELRLIDPDPTGGDR